ncbi:hypothetical protein ACWG8W_06185 [Citricoccus zhacaiensis]
MPAAVIESVIDRFKAPSMSGEKAEQFAEALQDLSVEYEARKAAVVKNSEDRKQAAQDAYEEALATSDTMQVLDSLAKDINTDKLRAVRRARAEKELAAALANDDDMGAELAQIDEWVMAEIPSLLVDFGFKEAGKKANKDSGEGNQAPAETPLNLTRERRLELAHTGKGSVLLRLVADEDAEVRAAVASNPRFRPRFRMNKALALAFDPSPLVRIEVAKRIEGVEVYDIDKNVSRYEWPREMFKLAKDEDADVRAQIARHRNLPDEVVEAMVRDSSAKVRAALMRGEFRSKKIVRSERITRELFMDKDTSVREAVAYWTDNERVTLALSKDKEPTVRAAVAKGSSYQEILRTLASDTDMSVRINVAMNKSISEGIALKVLAKDPEKKVRVNLASASTSPTVMAALTKDPDFRVRKALLSNLNVSGHVLHLLLGTGNEEFDGTVLEAIKKHRKQTAKTYLPRLARGLFLVLVAVGLQWFATSIGVAPAWEMKVTTTTDEFLSSVVATFTVMMSWVAIVLGGLGIALCGIEGTVQAIRWSVQDVKFRKLKK